MNYIPVYTPSLTSLEKNYVIEALDSSWISSKGDFIKRFENKFSDFTGIKYSTVCTNGTVAIHLCLLALGVAIDDEVIVPSFTYVASVNPIKMVGAVPVFVDIDRESLQLNIEDFKTKISDKTVAVIIPHIYGNMTNMDEFLEIARKNKIYVIEDAAEAFGSYYKNKHAGHFGDISSFSFFGNKTITTGEGGMVCSDNKYLIDKVIHYKGQGLESLNPDKHETKEYWHDVVGYNYRMTNLCAAIGLAQIERANEILQKKAKVAGYYMNYLSENENIRMLLPSENVRMNYWMITIILKDEYMQKKVRRELQKEKIETRPLFPPVHTMPMYNDGRYLQNTEEISSVGLNLPSYPTLPEDSIKRICHIINSVI
jgi:perosamine synthetase